jgi:RNA polymerase sigma factor (sigma-70 family)
MGNQGPGEVLPELCERLRPRFRRLLHAYRVPPQDGEDLIQTTLLLALLKWRDIRFPYAWVLGTLRTRCLVYGHERRRRGQLYEPLADRALEATAAPAQPRRDLLADLETLSRGLPRRQRAALALRYGMGHELLEVAAATGLTHSSVKTTLHRAVAHLRRAAAAPAPARRRGGTRIDGARG